MMSRAGRYLLLAVLLASSACTRQVSVPKPEDAVAQYAAAVESGDVDGLYALMSDESRRAISREQLATVLRDQKKELSEHAAGLRSTERSIKAQADVRYGDGEVVSLQLADGRFKVDAADALPAAARSPAQALGQLRRVLARRSYPGLLRLLTPQTRAAVERDMRSLVEGLADPDALIIDVLGDTAVVEVPGGHQVKLKREEGVWHVEDFD